MRGEIGDPYARLLAQWYAWREVADAYHRALRFLTPPGDDASEHRRQVWRELNQKLTLALIALRQASDQLQRFEQGRGAASRP